MDINLKLYISMESVMKSSLLMLFLKNITV
jgi:hypothetical protein